MANLKYILDGNGNRVYPITVANGVVYIKSDKTQVKLSDWLAQTDEKLASTSTSATVAAKANKVTTAKEGNLASLTSDGDLADSGKKAADFATAAQGSKADTAVQSVATGSANGTISVDDTDVAVTGLGSAAYTDSTAYDTAGAASTVETNLKGTDADTKDSETIKGAKKYADDAVSTALTSLAGALQYKGTVSSTSALPTEGLKTGDTYAVAEAGTYADQAMEAGDYLIYNGTSWDGINGENQVSNDNTDLIIGTAVQVATVDGTTISVKQVEDTTKLECKACGDTTEYADVSSLFTATTTTE